jgi:hypothetical protein
MFSPYLPLLSILEEPPPRIVPSELSMASGQSRKSEAKHWFPGDSPPPHYLIPQASNTPYRQKPVSSGVRSSLSAGRELNSGSSPEWRIHGIFQPNQ